LRCFVPSVNVSVTFFSPPRSKDRVDFVPKVLFLMSPPVFTCSDSNSLLTAPSYVFLRAARPQQSTNFFLNILRCPLIISRYLRAEGFFGCFPVKRAMTLLALTRCPSVHGGFIPTLTRSSDCPPVSRCCSYFVYGSPGSFSNLFAIEQERSPHQYLFRTFRFSCLPLSPLAISLDSGSRSYLIS